MKIATVIGARPQFVKAAVVSREIKNTEGIAEEIIHTGQHYDDEMSKLFFNELDITTPKYNLEVGSSSLTTQTADIMKKLEPVLLAEKPDIVMVYGDTNSTLAGAIVASQLNIPLAHVEAGLRSFNRAMPEEKNRVVTDHLSTLLYAPTKTAIKNLAKEGISDVKAELVGDVMYDAALYYSAKAEKNSDVVARMNLQAKNYVLATIHRAENTDSIDNLKSIIDSFIEISKQNPVVIPVHPRTQKVLKDNKLLDHMGKNIVLLPPVGYLDMIALTKNAKTIMTDSGGLQKEAYFFKVPCLTLRNETEWTELVDCGANKLTGASKDKILSQYNSIQEDYSYKEGLYGDGYAARLIVSSLMKSLKQ